MTTSALLPTHRSVDLPSGRIEYHESGTGAPVLFVHGLLVNADLWRNVVPTVAAAGFHCLAPNWPLGGHRVPMPPSADLSPPGLAGLIADFLTELDLTDVTVVANDTGVALTQLLMAEHPERLARVVLTPGDALDCFFPPMVRPLQYAARVPGAMWLLTRLVRWPAIARSPAAFGLLTGQPLSREVLTSYLGPAREDAAVRRDLRRVLVGVHPRYTLAAAERLPGFSKPVLLVAADREKVFPARLADRLAELLPDVRRATVADSYTFVPEDQPAELARLLVEFLRSS